LADETIGATKGFTDIIVGGEPESGDIIVRTLNGATHAGHFVTTTGETYPAVAKAVTTDEGFLGIVRRPAKSADLEDWTVDTEIADNIDVEIVKPTGGRLQIAAFLEATAGPIAVVPGDYASLGTEAGKVRKLVYADAAAATDSFMEVVGKIVYNHAGHATEDRIVVLDY